MLLQSLTFVILFWGTLHCLICSYFPTAESQLICIPKNILAIWHQNRVTHVTQSASWYHKIHKSTTMKRFVNSLKSKRQFCSLSLNWKLSPTLQMLIYFYEWCTYKAIIIHMIQASRCLEICSLIDQSENSLFTLLYMQVDIDNSEWHIKCITFSTVWLSG